VLYGHRQFHLSHTERGPRRRARTSQSNGLTRPISSVNICYIQMPISARWESSNPKRQTLHQSSSLQTAFQDVLPIEAWWYEGLSQGEGVPKTFVKQNVRHEQYLDILRYWTKTSCSYLAFRSWNHRNVTRRHEKVCLSCIDNKSPLLPDCVHSGLQTLKYHGRRMRSHASPCKARARGKGRLTVYICVNKNDITWTKTVSFIAHTHTKL